MMRVVCSVLFLAVSCYGADRPPKLRLAEVEDIAPTGYRVDLTLDPVKNNFAGIIDIKITVVKPVETIWLNGNKINVLNAELTSGSKKLAAKPVAGGDDFIGLEFGSTIPEGPAEIRIHYTGSVRRDSSGVFRAEDSGNGYILTQFEATDAREAFPCFDEPSYKTPWQLTLRVPAQDKAISNTPVVSDTAEGGIKKYVFRETKPLPSYLVAFGVGPFEFVDAGVAGRNRFPVRIVTPKGRAREAKYAAEVTATILTRLEDYFGIPYPYEKSDQVAVPVTTGFGAMENAGMVTYGQTLILADPASDTISRQRRYAEVAAHELAHQWFGDLVTTAWWDDIWLNEAFATWMEQKLIAEWKPEWKTGIDDVDSKLYAEDRDSLVTARKIRQPIRSKDDIGSAFDAITYQKGAAVIGMFESWIGPGPFREGVQKYLRLHAFKNATAADFLDALGSQGKGGVKEAFSTFLNQAGVPLVSVSLDCGHEAPTLHLEQSRYLPLGSKSPGDETWSIPVCVRYNEGSECTLMSQPKMDWVLKSARGCPAWIEANDHAKGYYRMDYQGGLLSALTGGGVDTRLGARERVDLIGNAQAMTKAGKLPAAAVLGLVETFHSDSERDVVERALDVALFARADMVPAELMPNYRRFLLKNFQARARELGWIPEPGEPDEVRLLRPSLLLAVATYGGDQQLGQQASELAQRWLGDHAAVRPEVLGSVLDAAAYYGGLPLFNQFLEQFKKTQYRQDKQRLLAAMVHFRDPAAIQAAMQAVLSGSISLADGLTVLLSSGQSEPETRKMPFDFVKAHYDQITKGKPGIFGFDLGAFLPRIGSSYCDAGSRDELQSFFGPRVVEYGAGQRVLAQVVEGIDQCIAVKAAQESSVAEFLRKF